VKVVLVEARIGNGTILIPATVFLLCWWGLGAWNAMINYKDYILGTLKKKPTIWQLKVSITLKRLNKLS
jgi:hypothetical protein